MDLSLQPTLAGAALAAVSVAGGGPLFGEGLRALRLRRYLARLTERRLGEAPTGFVRVQGRVALESPLFGPLSGKPCAGFQLEVGTAGHGPSVTIEERRAFRLVGDGANASILAGSGRWSLSVTERREFRSSDPLTANLTALLARSPEAQWLRRSGLLLVFTERALIAGQQCHVVGHARESRPFELPAEVELRSTGTDDAVRIAGASLGVADRTAGAIGSASADPDLWIDGGQLEFLFVSDRPPGPRDLSLARIRTLGLVLGPLLSLGGLLYLAHAADVFRATGRF